MSHTLYIVFSFTYSIASSMLLNNTNKNDNQQQTDTLPSKVVVVLLFSTEVHKKVSKTP